MPDSSPSRGRPPVALSSRVMLGIGLKIVSVFVFVAMSSFIKAAEGVPPGQLVFARSFFGIFPILLFLMWRRELLAGLRTDRPLAHVSRGLVGVVGMAMTFFALGHLPLPEAITINYATPLFIVIMGALVLGERVRIYRWSAVLLGLLGVLIVMWPSLTIMGSAGEMDGRTLGALVALGSCVISAIAMVMVRGLVHTERSATIAIYFSLTATVGGLLTLPLGWVWPTPGQWAVMIGAGIAGGIGQILLTESFRHADVSVIAPFEYSSMLLAIAAGYLLFGDVPTPQMLVGGAIVVASGLIIILRERHLGRMRAHAAAPAPAE